MPTDIQWTDETWNPVTGCTRVSPGCSKCYIERTPPFRMQGRRFARVGNEETTGVLLHPDRLEQPLHWRKPRRVFVCSLADLFHDDVPFEYIDRVFGVIEQSPQHTFQVLTKRPERMRDYFLARTRLPADNGALKSCDPVLYRDVPQLWLGVSIENARYTWRADVLREIPAAVRFISAEPLLGSLYPPTAGSLRCPAGVACSGCRYCETERERLEKIAASPASEVVQPTGPAAVAREGGPDTRGRAALDLTGIDWIIVGGESGPGARPFHLEHAREIILACRDRDVVCCQNPPGECCGRPLDTGECCGQPVQGSQCCGEPEQLGPGPAVFVKQLGARPVESGERYAARVAVAVECEHGYDVCPECDAADVELKLRDRKGGDIDEFPPDLRVREFPRPAGTRERSAVA